MIFLFLSDICYPNNTTLNRKADSLFNKGLYIESTLLYELEIFNTDNLEKINYLLLKKTKALRYSNNIKEAYRNLFRINATQILNDTLLSEYYFELTFCSYLTGNYEIAKEYASEINNDYIKNDMYSLLKCMIYLKSSEYDTLYYLISTNNLLHDSLLADYEIQYTKQKEIYTKINTISNKKKITFPGIYFFKSGHYLSGLTYYTLITGIDIISYNLFMKNVYFSSIILASYSINIIIGGYKFSKKLYLEKYKLELENIDNCIGEMLIDEYKKNFCMDNNIYMNK